MYLQRRVAHAAAARRAGSRRIRSASLDVSVLQDGLLAPVLKIADVRTDKRIDFVGGARGTGARAGGRLRQGGGRVFAVSGQRRRPDGGLRRRRDHAAQVHLVRAQAARRLADSRHMKVLVADKFEQSGLDGLKAAGCEVIYQPDLKDDALTQALRDTAADVLVVRSTAVTAPMLEAGSLSLVVRAGAGYNTIDVAAASKRGIYVSNCPGKNAIAVAELAFALMLALDRRVPDNVADLRAGTWNKKEYSKARGLFGRTLGLLGYGNIGQEMAKRAHAFGMPIVVWSRRFATGKDKVADEPIPMQLADVTGRRRGALRRPQRPPRAERRHQRPRQRLGARPAEARVVLHQHGARRGRRPRGARAARSRERGIRVGLDVFANEPSGATGAFSDPLTALPERLRHAPHRRVHRSGAGSDRRRDRAHRRVLQGHRQGAERRQPGEEDAGDAHAGRPPPRSARRARARLRAPARRQHQRAGNRERDLRRRAGGGRAHQPRRRAVGRRAQGDQAATPTSSTSSW